MSNCQSVNIIPTDTRFISLEFPTSPYEQNSHHYSNNNPNLCSWAVYTTETITKEWPLHVRAYFEGMFVDLLIIVTLHAKKQRVIHTFGTAWQECLTLKLEATRTFEVSGTAPNPTRPEPSTRNSNTAYRTWNQTTVRPADWTEQLLYRWFPTNQVSAVQSQCKCLSDCSVLAFW